MSDLFGTPEETVGKGGGQGGAGYRPLADRLRPTRLGDVLGQEHLSGKDGVLTRMIRSGALGSLIFWGPPGTGKTTIARLLADETGLAFEQLSAIFSGVLSVSEVTSATLASGSSSATSSAIRSTPGPHATRQSSVPHSGQASGMGTSWPQWWQASRCEKRCSTSHAVQFGHWKR